MHSMTGYGVGSAALGEGRVTLEVRSINSRFLDVRVRASVELTEYCFFMEQLARERLHRGRFELSARRDGAASATLALARARDVYKALALFRDEVAPGTELSLATLAAFPEVFSSTRDDDPEAVRSALGAALSAALEQLQAMRRSEGSHLRAAVRQSLSLARTACRQIEERAEGAVSRYRARLRDRLERLLAETNAELDPGRLEAELALLADRSDIAEELVRLRSHFDHLESLLEAETPVGRKLEFLLQEVSREANTIGAKSQDSPIAHLVVEMKSEVEKIREQVQNVE